MNGLTIEAYDKTITAAATPESLKVAGKTVLVSEVILRADDSNSADDMFLGTSDGQTWPLKKGEVTRLSEILNRMSYGGVYNLSEIYVKAGTNGDSVHVLTVILDS